MSLLTLGCCAPRYVLNREELSETFEVDLPCGHSGGRAGCDGRGLTSEDGATVGVGRDASGLVHAESGEVVPALQRVSLVYTDAKLRREALSVALIGEAPLDRDGAVDRVSRAREDREEPVAPASLFHL